MGIGESIAQDELETIAGSPSQVVNAESFEDLSNQLDNIKNITCSKVLCNSERLQMETLKKKTTSFPQQWLLQS